MDCFPAKENRRKLNEKNFITSVDVCDGLYSTSWKCFWKCNTF